MSIDIAGAAFDLLWSLILAAVFWAVLAAGFGIKRNPIISILVLSVAVFGLSVVFDITAGLLHIWTVAYVAVLNNSFSVFSLGAILAVAGVAALLISALAVLLREAVDG